MESGVEVGHLSSMYRIVQIFGFTRDELILPCMHLGVCHVYVIYTAFVCYWVLCLLDVLSFQECLAYVGQSVTVM